MVKIALSPPTTFPARLPGKVLVRRLVRLHTGTIGLAIITVIVVMAITAPWLMPFDPYEQTLAARLKPPGWANPNGQTHLMGTDQLGRDVFSRLILGSRVSLLVALGAVPIAAALGTIIGLVSGYKGGRLDEVLMRLTDIQLSLPFMLLILAVVAVLGPSLRNVIIVLGVTEWVHYTKMVRGEALSMRHREFVLASRALGGGIGRILFMHILPNVTSAVIVLVTLSVPRVIVAEASLSFLGLGIQPPTPSWGGMLSQGREYIWNAWWLSTFSGLFISITVLGVNLVGDWIRDMLDPHLSHAGAPME